MKEIKFHPSAKDTHLTSEAPVPSITVLPNWYKNMPPFTNGAKKISLGQDNVSVNTTVKRCIPFMDSMTAGYTFCLPDDLFVEQYEQETIFRWRTNHEHIAVQSIEQIPNMILPLNHRLAVFKFTNNWGIETPKGYSLFITHPSNRFDLPFLTVNGFVDTDFYNIPITFPFFIKKDFEGVLEKGTPLAQLIPIKRDDWKHKIEPFDEERMARQNRKLFGKIIDSYKKQFWQKKSYR
jgi:hypothetical protein